MIVRRAGEALVPASELEPQAAAYIDPDWLAEGAAHALVVAGRDSDEDAAAALMAHADAVLAALAGVPDATVAIVGDGAVAQIVRARLGDRASEVVEGARTAAVADMTGAPGALARAARAAADEGLVVLAGGAPVHDAALDVYPDLHRRGLRVVAIPPPQPTGSDSGAALAAIGPPVRVAPGAPAPPASWYRVDR